MIFGEKFPKILLLFLILFSLAQIAATLFFLYWRIFWFDNVMHFFGGALIAMGAIWWAFYLGSASLSQIRPPFLFTLVFILGFVALGGIIWEFYELIIDRLIADKDYIQLFGQGGLLDTLKDLLVNLVGGSAAGLVFLYERNKRT